MRGFVRENPDTRVQGHYLSGQKCGLKHNSYLAERPGSLSSVSGVNRPIRTAK